MPADGTVPYLYVTIPTNLKEDIWIRGVELKPSDRRVVHHIISNLVEGNGKTPDPEPKLTRDPARKEIGGGLGGLVPGRLVRHVRRRRGAEDSRRQRHRAADALHDDRADGHRPDANRRHRVEGTADEPARGRGRRRFRTWRSSSRPAIRTTRCRRKYTFDRDTYLSTLYPHMHVRGKDVTYTVIYPDGREEVVLRVPKYDFNWQLSYKLAEPKFLPKGPC